MLLKHCCQMPLPPKRHCLLSQPDVSVPSKPAQLLLPVPPRNVTGTINAANQPKLPSTDASSFFLRVGTRLSPKCSYVRTVCTYMYVRHFNSLSLFYGRKMPLNVLSLLAAKSGPTSIVKIHQYLTLFPSKISSKKCALFHSTSSNLP